MQGDQIRIGAQLLHHALLPLACKGHPKKPEIERGRFVIHSAINRPGLTKGKMQRVISSETDARALINNHAPEIKRR